LSVFVTCAMSAVVVITVATKYNKQYNVDDNTVHKCILTGQGHVTAIKSNLS